MARNHIVDEWIQVRINLHTHPRVTRMLASLEGHLARYIFRSSPDDLFAGAGVPVSVSRNVSEVVSEDVLRDVIVSGLVRVWGQINRHIRDDQVRDVPLKWLDTLASIPGFGAAMQTAGWVHYDSTAKVLTFPNFEEWNTPKSKARRSSETVRKERYRLRQWLKTTPKSHPEWAEKSARLSTLEGRDLSTDTGRDKDADGTPPKERKGKDTSVQQQQPETPRKTGQAIPTIEEALAYANRQNSGNTLGLVISIDCVHKWHDDRTSVGWITVKGGLELPITDWPSNLNNFARDWQTHEAAQRSREKLRLPQRPRASREPDTVHTSEHLPAL